MNKILIYSTLLSFSFSSCLVLLYGRYGREPLSMTREDFRENSLKTDGFYHYRSGKSFLNVVLFRNGIYFAPMATPYPKNTKDVKEAEEYFKTITKENNPYHDVVFAWGIFKIEHNDLTIEKWMSGDGGNKYRVGVGKGRILNDTTFVQENYPTTINGFPFELDEMMKKSKKLDTFRFVKTSIKPDSTCPFIPY